jgi:hypothetical protein
MMRLCVHTNLYRLNRVPLEEVLVSGDEAAFADDDKEDGGLVPADMDGEGLSWGRLPDQVGQARNAAAAARVLRLSRASHVVLDLSLHDSLAMRFAIWGFAQRKLRVLQHSPGVTHVFVKVKPQMLARTHAHKIRHVVEITHWVLQIKDGHEDGRLLLQIVRNTNISRRHTVRFPLCLRGGLYPAWQFSS